MKRLFLPWWERRALNSFVSGKYAKAEKYFLKIAIHFPRSSSINYNLGLVKLSQNNLSEAKKYFIRDIVLGGISFKNLKALGDLSYFSGNIEETRRFYNEAMVLCTDEKEKKLMLVRIKCDDEKVFSSVKKSHAYLYKGNLMLKKKKYNLALENFNAASRCDETNYFAFNNQGTVLLHYLKDPDSALSCFTKAEKLCDMHVVRMNKNRAKQLAKETVYA